MDRFEHLEDHYTVAELRNLADEQGIEITATKKADIINELLAELPESFFDYLENKSGRVPVGKNLDGWREDGNVFLEDLKTGEIISSPSSGRPLVYELMKLKRQL